MIDVLTGVDQVGDPEVFGVISQLMSADSVLQICKTVLSESIARANMFFFGEWAAKQWVSENRHKFTSYERFDDAKRKHMTDKALDVIIHENRADYEDRLSKVYFTRWESLAVPETPTPETTQVIRVRAKYTLVRRELAALMLSSKS